MQTFINEDEEYKVLKDAVMFGTGYCLNGKHIPFEEVIVDLGKDIVITDRGFDKDVD